MLLTFADYRSRYGRTLWEQNAGNEGGGSGGTAAGAGSGGSGSQGGGSGSESGSGSGAGAGSGGESGSGGGGVKFDEAQQLKVNALIREAEERGKNKADQAVQAQKDKDDQARQQRDLEAKQQYEAAKKIESDRADAAEGRATKAEGDLARVEAILKTQVEALEKEVPEEARQGYKADASMIDRLTFLQDRKDILAVALALSKKGGESNGGGAGQGGNANQGSGTGGTVTTPDGSEGDGFDEEAAKKATAYQWRDF